MTLLIKGTSNGGTLGATATSPSPITADQHNYDSGGLSLIQRLSSDASRSLTGFKPGNQTQVDGQTHYIRNVGSNNIVLVNESASSTAANRFTTSTGSDLTIGANKAALVQYDATSARWRAVLLP